MTETWMSRFVLLAKQVATWSKDDTQVGCVLISPDRKQICYGYNGQPTGFDWEFASKEQKNLHTIHAEANAILNSSQSLFDWYAFVTKPVCTQCAGMLKQKQIGTVVMPHLDPKSSWFNNQAQAVSVLTQAQINIVYIEDLPL